MNSQCLLVQGYLSSSTWGFPKGKAEDGEDELQSAVRETYEETGFDIQPLAKEEWYIEKTINEQHYKLYIVPGVSEHYKFSPQTRKEIRVKCNFSMSYYFSEFLLGHPMVPD